MRYAIHYTDGAKMDSLTLDGAMRLIACRHRVTPADLVTDTSEERILVWLYHGESTIAEVIASSLTELPAVTQNRPLKVEIKGLNTGHSLGVKNIPGVPRNGTKMIQEYYR
jgi:hypothetical protein